MKKIIALLFIAFSVVSCAENKTASSVENSSETAQQEIDKTLNNWHRSAAKADFEAYFSTLTEDAIYIGTDATENWDIAEFKGFAKPYFEKGKAWDFTAVERNIFLSKNGQIAWFDELLKTWMGLCRGSGVLVKQDGKWKIKHYVLSVTVPNDRIEETVRMKSDFDKNYLKKIPIGKK
ncbi:MAG TPA: nuclear transport factor 2 family protein [Flavobacteriaceae bacterium]|nr:nuclear transport factor 2 family protein [Flavobacteriaceae bacterium]